MQLVLQTGPQIGSDNVPAPARGGRTGELMVSELQGRFYENCYRNNLYSIGCTLTALAASTLLLGATAQPIVGIWNPLTSPVNLVILQVALRAQVNAASATAAGDFILASSLGNVSLTAGLAPFARKTLAGAGSQAKAFTLSTASLLTGLTNNLVAIESLAEFNVPTSVNTTTVTAATLQPAFGGVASLDGSLIVPPGGVLALLNTVSTTTVSAAARLLWAEVAI